jgi:hypothetical protein
MRETRAPGEGYIKSLFEDLEFIRMDEYNGQDRKPQLELESYSKNKLNMRRSA